jgi:hypothetical protein
MMHCRVAGGDRQRLVVGIWMRHAHIPSVQSGRNARAPLVTNATLRSPVLPPGGGSGRHEAKVQETRQRFSENKERSIALLRKAISTLEDEIAEAGPVVDAATPAKATSEVCGSRVLRPPYKFRMH